MPPPIDKPSSATRSMSSASSVARRCRTSPGATYSPEASGFDEPPNPRGSTIRTRCPEASTAPTFA
jgi:hypothetical protein